VSRRPSGLPEQRREAGLKDVRYGDFENALGANVGNPARAQLDFAGV